MTFSVPMVFLVIAFVLFLLEAFGVPRERKTNLGWLGLALVTLYWLVAGGAVRFE